jgi:hypothetical protein
MQWACNDPVPRHPTACALNRTEFNQEADVHDLLGSLTVIGDVMAFVQNEIIPPIEAVTQLYSDITNAWDFLKAMCVHLLSVFRLQMCLVVFLDLVAANNAHHSSRQVQQGSRHLRLFVWRALPQDVRSRHPRQESDLRIGPVSIHAGLLGASSAHKRVGQRCRRQCDHGRQVRPEVPGQPPARVQEGQLLER